MSRPELDLAHLERLAHLDLAADERALLAERLTRLLDWCGSLLPVLDGSAPAEPIARASSGPCLRDDRIESSCGGVGLPAADQRVVDGYVVTPSPSGRCDERG